MDTDHTKAVLKRLMLNNVDKHEAMKMILDNELDLLSDSCDNPTVLNNNVSKHEVMREMVVDDEPSLSENPVTTECEYYDS